jgi:2-hydroxychromene-2-carboxylate isomerase
MSDKQIPYYFTITSPWSYLGHAPFLKLADELGYDVQFKPVDFGAVFAQSGGTSIAEAPLSATPYTGCLSCSAGGTTGKRSLNIRPKHFPVDPTLGNNMVMVAAEQGLDAGKLATAFMRGCWVDEQDVGDKTALIAAADSAGLDGAALATEAESSAAQERADVLTEEAKKAQVFGAPTYIIRGEPFWGQDRLELVERAMRGQAPAYAVEEPF